MTSKYRTNQGTVAEIANGEVVSCVEKHPDGDHAWPGNFRELEQCVRNIWIRKTYRPVTSPTVITSIAEDTRFEAAHDGKPTAE